MSSLMSRAAAECSTASISSEAIYRAPSGRLCRLMWVSEPYVVMAYLAADGKLCRHSGFTLSAANVWMLKAVP